MGVANFPEIPDILCRTSAGIGSEAVALLKAPLWIRYLYPRYRCLKIALESICISFMG